MKTRLKTIENAIVSVGVIIHVLLSLYFKNNEFTFFILIISVVSAVSIVFKKHIPESHILWPYVSFPLVTLFLIFLIVKKMFFGI